MAAWRTLERRQSLRLLVAAAAALALLAAPFAAWNPSSFLADTAGFFHGSGVDSYPIRGIGLPGLLLSAGVIPSRWSPYPAAILEAVVACVVISLAALHLRRPSLQEFFWPLLWGWMGIFVLAVFFVGRVLAPNYLDIALVLLGLSAASALQNQRPAAGAVAGHIDAVTRQ
jgi:hypothetical protein